MHKCPSNCSMHKFALYKWDRIEVGLTRNTDHRCIKWIDYISLVCWSFVISWLICQMFPAGCHWICWIWIKLGEWVPCKKKTTYIRLMSNSKWLGLSKPAIPVYIESLVGCLVVYTVALSCSVWETDWVMEVPLSVYTVVISWLTGSHKTYLTIQFTVISRVDCFSSRINIIFHYLKNSLWVLFCFSLHQVQKTGHNETVTLWYGYSCVTWSPGEPGQMRCDITMSNSMVTLQTLPLLLLPLF